MASVGGLIFKGAREKLRGQGVITGVVIGAKSGAYYAKKHRKWR